jgi:hypothetical protein
MVQVYSTKRQRSIEKNRGIGPWILAAAVLVVLLAITGCAGTLDKAVATCYALEGSPAFTKAEGLEKFECARPGLTTVRASR